MILALVVQIALLHPTMMTVTYRILTKAASRMARTTPTQHLLVLMTTNFRLLRVHLRNSYRNICGLVESLCLPSMVTPLLLPLGLYRKSPPLETLAMPPLRRPHLHFHLHRPRLHRLRLHLRRQHHPLLVLARYHYLFLHSRHLHLHLLSLVQTQIPHQIPRARRS